MSHEKWRSLFCLDMNRYMDNWPQWYSTNLSIDIMWTWLEILISLRLKWPATNLIDSHRTHDDVVRIRSAVLCTLLIPIRLLVVLMVLRETVEDGHSFEVIQEVMIHPLQGALCQLSSLDLFWKKIIVRTAKKQTCSIIAFIAWTGTCRPNVHYNVNVM